jgi:hypothetical protein
MGARQIFAHRRLWRECVKRRKNPPTGRLGYINFSLLSSSGSLQSPNRRVGVHQLQPTVEQRLFAIPQPEGWGTLTSAYCRAAAFCNPPTGRLGIFHSYLSCIRDSPRFLWARMKNPQPPGWGICGRHAASLVGWTEKSPTSRLGFSHNL